MTPSDWDQVVPTALTPLLLNSHLCQEVALEYLDQIWMKMNEK